jgi:hypothetical protein
MAITSIPKQIAANSSSFTQDAGSAVRFRLQPLFLLGFNCRKKISHSFCRHGRNTSAAAFTEVAAIVWPAAEHDY